MQGEEPDSPEKQISPELSSHHHHKLCEVSVELLTLLHETNFWNPLLLISTTQSRMEEAVDALRPWYETGIFHPVYCI